jgi:DNA-binding transcriptional LysR family regulator
MLIAAVASVAPGVCIRFAPKPEKTSRYLREGLVDLEIGVQSNMGPEIRLQRLFQDRFVGAVRKGHPLSSQPESALTIMLPGAMWWRRLMDRYTGLSMTRWRNGDETKDRQRGAWISDGVIRGAGLRSDCYGTGAVPAQSAMTERVHVFELPFKTRTITVSQMWHPRMERDPAHRWLREKVLEVCRRFADAQSTFPGTVRMKRVDTASDSTRTFP